MKRIFGSILIVALLVSAFPAISCSVNSVKTPEEFAGEYIYDDVSEFVRDDISEYLSIAYSLDQAKLEKKYGEHLAEFGAVIAELYSESPEVRARIANLERFKEACSIANVERVANKWSADVVISLTDLVDIEATFSYCYLGANSSSIRSSTLSPPSSGKWELINITYIMTEKRA